MGRGLANNMSTLDPHCLKSSGRSRDSLLGYSLHYPSIYKDWLSWVAPSKPPV